MTTISANEVRSIWPPSSQMRHAARQVAAATAASAVSGLLVGGIGGRLAMMLLARLAPETTGVLSDDGFFIGLAIAVFVAIPGLYAALLSLLCERWLHPDGHFPLAPRWIALAPLIRWLPLAPALLAGALGWFGFGLELLRRQSGARALVEHPFVPWLARLVLGGLISPPVPLEPAASVPQE